MLLLSYGNATFYLYVVSFFCLRPSIYCYCASRICFVLCFYQIAFIIYSLFYQVERLLGFLMLLLSCSIVVFCFYKYLLTLLSLRLKGNIKGKKSWITLKNYHGQYGHFPVILIQSHFLANSSLIL